VCETLVYCLVVRYDLSLLGFKKQQLVFSTSQAPVFRFLAASLRGCLNVAFMPWPACAPSRPQPPQQPPQLATPWQAPTRPQQGWRRQMKRTWHGRRLEQWAGGTPRRLRHLGSPTPMGSAHNPHTACPAAQDRTRTLCPTHWPRCLPCTSRSHRYRRSRYLGGTPRMGFSRCCLAPARTCMRSRFRWGSCLMDSVCTHGRAIGRRSRCLAGRRCSQRLHSTCGILLGTRISRLPYRSTEPHPRMDHQRCTRPRTGGCHCQDRTCRRTACSALRCRPMWMFRGMACIPCWHWSCQCTCLSGTRNSHRCMSSTKQSIHRCSHCHRCTGWGPFRPRFVRLSKHVCFFL